jgi:hypothetical protein
MVDGRSGCAWSENTPPTRGWSQWLCVVCRAEPLTLHAGPAWRRDGSDRCASALPGSDGVEHRLVLLSSAGVLLPRVTGSAQDTHIQGL